MVVQRLLRGAIAYACAEGIHWCWCTHQSNTMNAKLPPYIDGPSGRPFTGADRRSQVERILRAEFGAGDTSSPTPERGRRWLQGWFFDAPFETIHRESARAWLAWAYFNYETPESLTPAEAEEIDADLARIEELASQKLARSPAPSARNGALVSMRPNADNTAPFRKHKPLFSYALSHLIVGHILGRTKMSGQGFTRHTIALAREPVAGGASTLSYWYRPPASDAAAAMPPLVFFHGVGLGLGFLYDELVADLVDMNAASRGAAIFCVEQPNICLTLPWDSGLRPSDAVQATVDMIAKHSAADASSDTLCADFIAHSYGTMTIAWLLKQRPSVVRSATLIDPVCVGAYRASLARNFLYEPAAPDPGFIEWLKFSMVHTDPRLVATLMRNLCATAPPPPRILLHACSAPTSCPRRQL